MYNPCKFSRRNQLNINKLAQNHFEFHGINVTGIELPDGYKYLQIISKDPRNDFARINYLIDSLGIRESNSQIRIIFPTKTDAMQYISKFRELEGALSDNFKIDLAETDHYEIAPIEIDYFASLLNMYHTGFTCEPLDIPSLNSDDFINMMVNSFAYKFTNREIDNTKKLIIEGKLRNIFPENTFLIKDLDGKILGSFTLIFAGNEIQLHSVAGRPVGSLSVLRNKLNKILYFVLIEAHKYGKTLTFTSRGASKLYSELGIRKSERYCLILNKLEPPITNSQASSETQE